jgi:hypothetical protein
VGQVTGDATARAEQKSTWNRQIYKRSWDPHIVNFFCYIFSLQRMLAKLI